MPNARKHDLICVGGGIMSATLALLAKLIDESINIVIFERLDEVGQESSSTLNNSGTGHSAYCELNYTPEDENGQILTAKAERIFDEFERSKQFWSYLMDEKLIEDPNHFIRKMPHCSWVRGHDLVEILRKRYKALSSLTPFESMQFTDQKSEIEDWFPILFMGRKDDTPMAATRIDQGTEIDFEKLTRLYFEILEKRYKVPVYRNHEVKDLEKKDATKWVLEVTNEQKEKSSFLAERVFIGAGGGALPLLQKTGIEQKDEYGGFPVSGQWLLCKNRQIIEKHAAKIYTKAGVDAPPMAAPHLDTRYVDGKKELIFGPFAGFSTKFLKEGSYLDLPASINTENIPAYWGAFWHNLPLTKYLVKQLAMTHSDRVETLREFIPNAKEDDWELVVAGQRVQVIKKDDEKGGDVEFGTDVVSNKEESVAALLGASPGASVAVHVMLDVLQRLFSDRTDSPDWQKQIDLMIPFSSRSYADNPEEFSRLQNTVNKNLKLD